MNAKCIIFKTRRSHVVPPAPDVSGTFLLAMGRRPNTDDLGLEKAGVSVDKRGYIVVDDQLRTSAPGIWVAIATARALLRTPLSTMPKLSLRIFSITTRAG
jgi:alkyl hydroperoxide reductase subunit AhpF